MSAPASGPPAFVTDYVLRSDFLVWLIARLAPRVLLQAAGVPPSVQPDLSPQLRNELVDGFFPASARHVGLANDIRNAVRGWPDLPIEQLGMPVLLVGAADDPYQSGPIVRYSSGRIPGARMVLLERGGHILVGHERRIQQEVRDFLTTQAAKAFVLTPCIEARQAAAAEQADLSAGLQLASDISGISAFNLQPFVAEPHDCVGSGRDFRPVRALEALAQDRFNFLPVDHPSS